MSDTLLTIKEVSLKLGVHWQTVRNYIQKNQLKAYKIGRTLRVQKEDLEAFIKNLEKNEKSYVEIEKRYLLHDATKLSHRLLELGGTVAYQAHIIDHYFLPANIRNQKQHDIWFNEKRGCGVRIREQDNGYTGKVITSLETKRLTESLDHTLLIEAETDIESYDTCKRVLEMMDLKEFLTIDKNRVMYKLNEFKIALDDIKGFGAGVELEIATFTSQTEALKKLEELAETLHLHKKDLIKRSLTTLSMLKLARF
jgi:predicted adenylyl cyclase CyaB